MANKVPGTIVTYKSDTSGSLGTEQDITLLAPSLINTSGAKIRVASGEFAKTTLGEASVGYQIAKAILDESPNATLYVVPIDSSSMGTGATAEVAVIGEKVTSVGNFSLWRGTTKVADVSVAVDDTATAVAEKIRVALTQSVDALFTIALTDATITLTTKSKGEVSNGFVIVTDVYGADKPVTGLTFTVSKFTGATGSPSLATVFTGLEAEYMDFIVNPYTDAQSITDLVSELDRRATPEVNMPTKAISAIFGDETTVPSETISRTMWLAVYAFKYSIEALMTYLGAFSASAVEAYSSDPAANLEGTPVSTIKTMSPMGQPAQEVILGYGFCTYYANKDGVWRIQRMVSTDIEDPNNRNFKVPVVLSYLTEDLKSYVDSNNTGVKIVDPGFPVTPDSGKITSTDLLKGQLVIRLQEYYTRALIVDIEGTLDNLEVIRPAGSESLVANVPVTVIADAIRRTINLIYKN